MKRFFRQFTANQHGSAIIELIMVLPILAVLVCFIAEMGHLLIAQAAVDDAAYNVAHAYSRYPNMTQGDLHSVAATGPLTGATVNDLIVETPSPIQEGVGISYTHHLPNDGAAEVHKVYHDEYNIHLEYHLRPMTGVGGWIAGEKGYIALAAESSCVVDRTAEKSNDTTLPNETWWKNDETPVY